MAWPVGYVAVDSVMEAWSAERVLDTLAELGFEAVDWSSHHFDPLTQPPTAFRELVGRSRAGGLDVPQLLIAEDLVTADPTAWEQRVERTIRAVEAAAQAGVRSVGAATGPRPWDPTAVRVGIDLPAAEAWDLAERGLRRIVEHADGSGVRVAVEPVWGSLIDSAEGLQRMLDAVPGLGVTFDPSHLVLPGDDIPAWIHAWKDQIVHVHLKDAFGRRGMEGTDFLFPLLGEGSVPWKEVLTGLADAGYKGAASIEAESYRLLEQCYGNDPTEPARISLDCARRLYAMAGVDGA